jgi:hypothetical protein
VGDAGRREEKATVALFLLTQARKNPERRERERGEGEDARRIRREGRESEEREKTPEESGKKWSSVCSSRR